MNATTPKLRREYPHPTTLDNGAAVNLRLMTPADADRIVRFAQSLPEEDLHFLRIDICDPAVVATWVQNIEAGRTVTVLAEVGGEVVGYASLHRSDVAWQRHLGEIRIQVAPRFRSQGLGRCLADEVFAIARDLDLRKVTAQMVADQKAAITTFERLGFQAEALLQDFVIDRGGRTRDLVVMSYDVAGLSDRAD